MTHDLAPLQDPGLPARHEGGMAIAKSRQAQEVQAQMIMAKQFPRNEISAQNRIEQACMRKGLAEVSQYQYRRGGQMVTGPSIRLAEAMAQSWGNIDYGFIELERRPEETLVQCYAHDLETNTRRQMTFTASHWRHTKNGRSLLEDPRDIYEMIANQAARRVRACILAIIPGDVQDAAMARCNKTLVGDESVPLKDKISKMVQAFADSHGVTQAMLDQRLGFPVTSCTEHHLVTLRNIFISIKDGISDVDDWFSAEAVESESGDKSAAKETKQTTEKESKPKSRAAAAKSKTKAKAKSKAKTEEPAEEEGAEEAEPENEPQESQPEEQEPPAEHQQLIDSDPPKQNAPPFLPHQGEHPDDYVHRMLRRIAESENIEMLQAIHEAAVEATKSKHILETQFDEINAACQSRAGVIGAEKSAGGDK